MSLAVVDLLQPVKVDRHQREDGARPGASLHLEREVVMKGPMVAEPGQVVGAGLHLEALQLDVPLGRLRFATAAENKRRSEQSKDPDQNHRHDLKAVEEERGRRFHTRCAGAPGGRPRPSPRSRPARAALAGPWPPYLLPCRRPSRSVTRGHSVGDGERRRGRRFGATRAGTQIVERLLGHAAQRRDRRLRRPRSPRGSEQGSAADRPPAPRPRTRSPRGRGPRPHDARGRCRSWRRPRARTR